MYLLTLLSLMSRPSLSNSRWMRGAPQPGFSRHILRIRSRTSRAMRGRPRLPRRTFQVQNRRKPARCQATTVSGLTIANAERQPLQARRSSHQSLPTAFQLPSVCEQARRFRPSGLSVPVGFRRQGRGLRQVNKRQAHQCAMRLAFELVVRHGAHCAIHAPLPRSDPSC